MRMYNGAITATGPIARPTIHSSPIMGRADSAIRPILADNWKAPLEGAFS